MCVCMCHVIIVLWCKCLSNVSLRPFRVKKELQEIQDIDGKLTELADDNGVNTCDDNVPSNKKFSSFPLSQRTLQGLTEKGIEA